MLLYNYWSVNNSCTKQVCSDSPSGSHNSFFFICWGRWSLFLNNVWGACKAICPNGLFWFLWNFIHDNCQFQLCFTPEIYPGKILVWKVHSHENNVIVKIFVDGADIANTANNLQTSNMWNMAKTFNSEETKVWCYLYLLFKSTKFDLTFALKTVCYQASNSW